ncbi:MAG: phosphatase PAP2 family protein, partial [Spirochaetales bacterium]
VFAWVALSGLLDLWYLVFRVQGPKYWFADLHAKWYANFQGGFFVSLFQGMLENATLSGAAFPSSHVAEMTLFTLFAWRIDKRLFVVYSIVTVLVAAATVYLYAHYAVDSIAGFLLAIIIGPFLLKAWKPTQGLVDRLTGG